MYRKKTSIHLPETEQGYIFFLCMTLKKQPKEVRDRVIGICKEINADDWEIIYKVLTDKYHTLEGIAMEHYMQRKKLSLWRAIFYETYAKRYLREGEDVKNA